MFRILMEPYSTNCRAGGAQCVAALRPRTPYANTSEPDIDFFGHRQCCQHHRIRPLGLPPWHGFVSEDQAVLRIGTPNVARSPAPNTTTTTETRLTRA